MAVGMTVSITTVVNGIHQIHLGATSATLIETGDSPVLIDVGWKWSYNRLKDSLRALGYCPEDISLVAMTHYHPDHSGGMEAFRNKTGAHLAVHDAEALIYTSELPIPPIMYGWKGGLGILNPLLNLVGMHPTPADIILQDKEMLPSVADIEVIHTPGHTAGSVSFYIPSKQTLIVGDAMMYKHGKLSPPHSTFSHDNVVALDSIRKLTQYDCSVVCFSHYPPLIGDAQNQINELAASVG